MNEDDLLAALIEVASAAGEMRMVQKDYFRGEFLRGTPRVDAATAALDAALLRLADIVEPG